MTVYDGLHSTMRSEPWYIHALPTIHAIILQLNQTSCWIVDHLVVTPKGTGVCTRLSLWPGVYTWTIPWLGVHIWRDEVCMHNTSIPTTWMRRQRIVLTKKCWRCSFFTKTHFTLLKPSQSHSHSFHDKPRTSNMLLQKKLIMSNKFSGKA